MRMSVRLLGLDLFEFSIETDAPEGRDPGDCTTNAVGFSLPEVPCEYPVPDRDY